MRLTKYERETIISYNEEEAGSVKIYAQISLQVLRE